MTQNGSEESFKNFIKEGFFGTPSGRSQNLDALRDLLFFLFSVGLAFAIDRFVEPAEKPQRYFDEAKVLVTDSHRFHDSFPYHPKLGFRTEVWTKSGDFTPEESQKKIDSVFEAREKIPGYDELLLVYYWPDVPRVLFRVSKTLPQQLDGGDIPVSMVVGHPPSKEYPNGLRPFWTHSKFLEAYTRSLSEKLPQEYREYQPTVARTELWGVVFIWSLTGGLIGLILSLIILGPAASKINAFYYILAFGTLPLILGGDFIFGGFIEARAQTLGWVASLVWLLAGVGCGILLRLVRLQKLGDYLIKRHLPFGVALLGFRTQSFWAMVLLVLLSSIISVSLFLIFRRKGLVYQT